MTSTANKSRAAVPYVIGVLLFGAVLVAVYCTVEAIQDRRAAAAAMDLQMASMSVAVAETTAVGGQPVIDGISDPFESLRGRHELALDSLSPSEAAEARELLNEIAGGGSALVDPDAQPHSGHHERLNTLLETASMNAATAARQAERSAAIALGGGVGAVLVGAWLVLWGRQRTRTQRAQAEAQALAGQRVQSLINDLPEVFLVINPDGHITYRSASAGRLLPSSYADRADLVARAPESDRSELEHHLRRADSGGASAQFALTDTNGTEGWFELRVSDLTDDPLIGGHVITARDISHEVQLRSELKRQATTDLLTDLPNRRLLQATLEAATETMHSRESAVAFFTLDIDGFKVINDTHGHLAGDELLTLVAARLRNALVDGETLLRLGGDEFAIVAPHVASGPSAELRGKGLVELLDEPFRLGYRTENVRTSIGVAVTGDPAHTGSLLQEADIAMYTAKRAGGNAALLYQPEMNATAARGTTLIRALRAADYDTEFSLVYQPIVSAKTSEVAGMEALLRWNSPELGDVSPGEFIPLAESSGEICTIGRWVLETACAQLAAWIEAGMDPSITLSFNVSPRQIAQEDFVPGVLAIAQSWSVPAERLVVEVTETTALDDTGLAAERLEQLRAAGFRISIDDFGSGYSNLGQLLHIPFDVIKIDRSLLLTLSDMREQAGGDASDPCTIMEAIVSIAAVLDAPVICEGVETEEQRRSLEASGITHIQGYLTGRPAPASTITGQLLSNRHLTSTL